MQKLNKNVTMQQLLHGYKEGHRLLASSIKLPDSTEIELQRLTDLSGPSLIPGFETYVTGFPIIKNKYYTFSRTWYASEMKRPGCVWTHTLLIDFDDLYLIDALSFLNKLFQRPKSKKDFSAYNQSITITRKNETTKCILETYQENVLRGILQLFYEKPKKTIIIPIKDQTDIENIVNLIWIFQWPALKQSFSFCTGTLDPLKYIKNSFDLLFCPSDLRYIQFHDQKKVILYSDQDVINKPKPRWILNLIKEMQTVNTSKLKDFIIYNGIDLSEKRNNMQKLINIFYKLKNMKPNKQTEENLCDFIGNLFPKDTEAVQLKTSIFGPWEDMNNQSITYLDDKQALTQLINCEQQSAFNPKKLKIDKRSQQLWINNPNESKRMLRNVINLDPNPLGIAFIKGIAKAVQPNDLSRLLKDDPWIVNILVNHDPSLATQKMLWTTGPNVQEELFNAFIQGNSKKQNLIEPVIKAMLEAESDYVADEVESLLGSEIVPIVLNWLNSENAKSQFVEKRWIIILSNYIEEIIEWMKKTDKINLITTSTLVNILEPESFIIEQIPVKIWYKFVPELKNLVKDKSLDELCFFLIVGLQNKNTIGEEFVKHTFQPVHDSIKEDKLSFESWKKLRNYLVPSGFWFTLDRAERLRRTVFDIFLENKWDSQLFIETVNDPDTLGLISEYGTRTGSGRSFLKQVMNHLLTINKTKKRKKDNDLLTVLQNNVYL